jgi:hypothetical protein
VHKRANYHRHSPQSTKENPVPHMERHHNADHMKYEKKDVEASHGRKRHGSNRSLSETDSEGLESVSRLSGAMWRSNATSQSGLPNISRDSALHITCVAGVSEHPEKKYDRRPRRKTRPDKYEYKVNKGNMEKGPHEMTHNKTKGQPRKKTVFALNHDFMAPKVPQERLTLKSNMGPGVFHKGKASAPPRASRTARPYVL